VTSNPIYYALSVIDIRVFESTSAVDRNVTDPLHGGLSVIKLSRPESTGSRGRRQKNSSALKLNFVKYYSSTYYRSHSLAAVYLIYISR
jgi:hypothetical protein